MNNQFKQLLNTILVNINNGNFDKSKLLLTYALDINPKNYEVLSLMGYVCAIQKNLEEAEDYLNRALAINPNDAVAIFNLANLLSEHNKFEESIKLLERAENLYPTKSNLYHLHAKCTNTNWAFGPFSKRPKRSSKTMNSQMRKVYFLNC